MPKPDSDIRVHRIASDAKAIIDAVQDMHKPTVQTLQGLLGGDDVQASVLAVPRSIDLHSAKPFLEEWRGRPDRRSGIAHFTKLESFIDHLNRFKNDQSAIFAHDSMKDPSLSAVIDYHHGGPDGEPRFCRHRSQYDFPLSDEWLAWVGFADKGFVAQAEFAEHLQDRITDIVDPAELLDRTREVVESLDIKLANPASLLALSRGLSIHVNQQVEQHQNLSTGEAQIAWKEEHTDKAGQPMRVPGGFVLVLPVFSAGDAYQVVARLLYRVQGGRVFWRVALHRIDRVFRDAFEEACTEAAASTALPLFYGSPEI